MDIQPLIPRQATPELSVPTVSGERWSLSERRPEHFTMIVFYRGYHCPICAKYLRELDRKIPEFEKRGVDVIAVTSDGRDRAAKAHRAWRLQNVVVGYGLDLDLARRWGLYISEGIGTTSSGVEEPELFSEPAVYLVRPDGTLYFGAVQTMPFTRPDLDGLLTAIDKAVEKDYPARGEVVDHRRAAAAG